MNGLSIMDWSAAKESERRRVLGRGGSAETIMAEGPLRAAIAKLVEDVRQRGDVALLEALRTFDGLDLSASRLRVSSEEIAGARSSIHPALLAAIRTSIEQSRAFNCCVRDRASWTVTTAGGGLIGESAAPMPEVGLFVPSGKGSFPSVAVQIATPAVVAGVARIAVVVPPQPGEEGAVDGATLVALDELGVAEIYRGNGPAGIAALAFGTATIPRVRKIVGPGSPAVTVAELLVQQYGTVVEVGFGPTDAVIVADESADPTLLAADLINEAEHGPDSSAILISPSRATLEAVARAVGPQVDRLPEPRRGYATRSIQENGGLILVRDRAEALEVANTYAPEHLQLAVSDPRGWLPGVRYAGTALLGQWTTFAMSNFATGTPATLPTTGFAKVSSGVTAATYLVRTAVAELDESEFWRLAPTVAAFAEHEGFPGHSATIAVRRNR